MTCTLFKNNTADDMGTSLWMVSR